MKRRAFNQGLTSLGLAGLMSGVAGPSMAAKMLIYGNAGNIDSASNKFAKKWQFPDAATSLIVDGVKK